MQYVSWTNLFTAHRHWCPAEEREQKKMHEREMKAGNVSGKYNANDVAKY